MWAGWRQRFARTPGRKGSNPIMLNPGQSLAVGLSVVVLSQAGWWTVLNLVAIPRPRRRRGAGERPAFAVIIPAHNEERMVDRCVESLVADSYHPRPRMLVVADNCSDRTAELARKAGAEVLVRVDPNARGKAHALRAGFTHLRADSGAEPSAVIFVDADCEVDRGFFDAHADAFSRGAVATQAFYYAFASETTVGRLRSLALRLVHWGRPLGLARLGLGSGIKGSGMGIRWDAVETAMEGDGLAEDASMTIALARAGHAVTFVPHARVRGYFAGSYDEARVQDNRWEHGRLALAPQALTAAARALSGGHPRAAAGALDVASLPLTMVVALAALAVSVAVVAGGRTPLVLALLSVVAVPAYVLSGAVASRAPAKELTALWEAPRFFVHKLGVYRRIRRGRLNWERTPRS